MLKYTKHGISGGLKITNSKSYGSVSWYKNIYIVTVIVELI